MNIIIENGVKKELHEDFFVTKPDKYEDVKNEPDYEDKEEIVDEDNSISRHEHINSELDKAHMMISSGMEKVKQLRRMVSETKQSL